MRLEVRLYDEEEKLVAEWNSLHPRIVPQTTICVTFPGPTITDSQANTYTKSLGEEERQ